jgi:Flp pilus assembly protein TadD
LLLSLLASAKSLFPIGDSCLTDNPSPPGLETGAAEDPAAAIATLRKLLAEHPLDAGAYRALASALEQANGKQERRGTVTVRMSEGDPELMRASNALQRGDLETAEIILRRRLLERPADAFALWMMARLAIALRFGKEAEGLLRLAIELHPELTAASIDLARSLEQRGQAAQALEILDQALELDPGSLLAKSLKASNLGRVGRFDECFSLYEELLRDHPHEAALWSGYGHILKTTGRSEEGAIAMRRAVEIAPRDGEAWWNLANLKTAKFSREDVQTMLDAVAADPSDRNRVPLHFALGKAFEGLGENEAAFSHYAQGNELRRRTLDHDPDEVTEEVSTACSVFTKAFFEERAGGGCGAPDPIFIVGMTRAGSTLVEQMLASHSAIEGTKEFAYIGLIAREIGRRTDDYHTRLSALSDDQREAFGQQYLELMRSHRHEAKPLFIDKMPNNWLHVPLIQIILPNAKIIDVRRHPLACGLSNFRQHFARGQQVTYDLDWFGRFYADYVRLMAHIDAVLPGRVHRVFHERLVSDTEGELRRLLDYVGLPFEESCLRFYETSRAIYTPSSEQVRRPIDAAKNDEWRAFEQWLGPLKDALGPVLDSYPDVPQFLAD